MSKIPLIVGDYGTSVNAQGLECFILRRSDDPGCGLYYEVTKRYFSFQIDEEGPHLRLIAVYRVYKFSGDECNPRGASYQNEEYSWDTVRYTLESAAEYLK